MVDGEERLDEMICDGVLVATPAGSTAASIVANNGLRTLVLERAKMPRFHVGESLMPETYWTLERLGVIDQLNHSAFSRKIGVADGSRESARAESRSDCFTSEVSLFARSFRNATPSGAREEPSAK